MRAITLLMLLITTGCATVKHDFGRLQAGVTKKPEVRRLMGSPDYTSPELWFYYEQQRSPVIGWRNGGELGMQTATALAYRVVFRPLVWLWPKEWFVPRFTILTLNYLAMAPGYALGAPAGLLYGTLWPLDRARVGVEFDGDTVAAVRRQPVRLTQSVQRFVDSYGIVEIPLRTPEKAGGYSLPRWGKRARTRER